MRLSVHVYVLLALLAAGCGREDGGKVATVNAEGEIVVAALGDSINAGSPAWDPDPAVREQIGAALDPQSQWEYWASQADPRLRFRNCGVYGERTDQIAARLEECAEGADVLVVQGGINDIAQERDVERGGGESPRDGAPRQGARAPGHDRERAPMEPRVAGRGRADQPAQRADRGARARGERAGPTRSMRRSSGRRQTAG